MMIGARTAAWAAGWRNPYVTDGLVAMWDATWNAGPGVADHSQGILADLSGHGLTFEWDPATEGVSFGYDYIETKAAAQQTSIAALPAPPFLTQSTVESVDWIENFNSSNVPRVVDVMRMACDVCRQGVRIAFAYVENGIRHYCLNGPVTADYSTAVSLAFDLDDHGVADALRIGARYELLMNSYTERDSGTTVEILRRKSTDCRCYCKRVYNRILTDEERMRNLAIDRERFGIA